MRWMHIYVLFLLFLPSQSNRIHNEEEIKNEQLNKQKNKNIDENSVRIVNGVNIESTVLSLSQQPWRRSIRGDNIIKSHDMTEVVSNSLTEKHAFIANAVVRVYESMTKNDENYRFDLIFDDDAPDFSSTKYICPGDCQACEAESAEILCRFCCPDLFSEPLSFAKMSTQVGHSEIFYNHLVDMVMVAGTNPMSSSVEQRQGHDMARMEVNAMIRRFQWIKNKKSTSTLIPPPAQNSFVKPSQVCGYYEDGEMPGQRIMGGTEVIDTRRYPWQMSLATSFNRTVHRELEPFESSSTMFYRHHCGAALISERWVVTAAHCLYSMRRRRRRRRKLVVMGGFLALSERETAQIYEVEEFLIHERFVPRLYEQDIALMRLKTPVVYTPSLLPVCLPEPTHGRKAAYSRNLGRKATLTGWGRKWNHGPLATQLEKVELPVISNSECMDWYLKSGSRQFIPDSTFVCAGWEQGRMDACSGDSGGPLVLSREDGRAEMVGVVSWGIGCGVKGRPGVYTRVSEYVPWIWENIRKYEKNLQRNGSKTE